MYSPIAVSYNHMSSQTSPSTTLDREEISGHFPQLHHKGNAGFRTLYTDSFQAHFVGGRNGPSYGFLLDHSQFQEIIDSDDNSMHAKVYARNVDASGSSKFANNQRPCFSRPRPPSMAGRGGGTYETICVKNDGKWRVYWYRITILFGTGHSKKAGCTKTLYSLLIIALLLPLCSLPTRMYPGNPVATDQLDPGTHDNLKSNSTETNNREIYLARYQTWCDATIVSLTLLPWLMFTTHAIICGVGCGAKRKQCRNSCVTFRHLLTWGKFIYTVK